MELKIPTEDDLAKEIKVATRLSFEKLIQTYPGHYYYFTLITSGEAFPPIVSAWSIEALESAANNKEIRELIKWSYADSPFCFFGEEFFQDVKQLFFKRPYLIDLPDGEWEKEYDLRLNAMERALKELDEEGLFEKNGPRNSIVINAEVMPPDATNTERAIRLNPPEAIIDWLNEAAEIE